MEHRTQHEMNVVSAVCCSLQSAGVLHIVQPLAHSVLLPEELASKFPRISASSRPVTVESAAGMSETAEWRRKKTPWSSRPASHAATEFRGVYRLPSGSYGSSIWDAPSRTQVWLGTFANAEDAARIYAFAKAHGAAAAVKLPGAGKKRSRSRLRGVQRRSNGSYGASIRECKGRALTWLGTFGTAEEAGRAYDAAALRLHGARAVTNFGPDSVVVPPGRGTQRHYISMAEWQRVEELLRDMGYSIDDRDALIEAAATLHQIARAGHGDGGRDEMMNISDP